MKRKLSLPAGLLSVWAFVTGRSERRENRLDEDLIIGTYFRSSNRMANLFHNLDNQHMVLCFHRGRKSMVIEVSSLGRLVLLTVSLHRWRSHLNERPIAFVRSQAMLRLFLPSSDVVSLGFDSLLVGLPELSFASLKSFWNRFACSSVLNRTQSVSCLASPSAKSIVDHTKALADPAWGFNSICGVI